MVIVRHTIGCGRCAAVRALSTGSSRTFAESPAAVRIAIGGNFDESSVDSYPGLLQFLREQDFADKLIKVNFKPVIRTDTPTPREHCRSPPLAAMASRSGARV